MTKAEKDLAWLLLQPDHYMMYTKSKTGKMVYKIFDSDRSPVQYFTESQTRRFLPLIKTDSKKRITLNLALVRQLRANNHLKTLYVKCRKKLK